MSLISFPQAEPEQSRSCARWMPATGKIGTEANILYLRDDNPSDLLSSAFVRREELSAVFAANHITQTHTRARAPQGARAVAVARC